MHAFDLPELRTSYEKTKTILSETQINLDSMLTKCHFLEEQVVAKETFYTTREKELLDLHRHELDKGKQIITKFLSILNKILTI